MPRLGAALNSLNPLSKDDASTMMAVYKDRFLVVSKNGEGRFLVEGKNFKA